MKSICAIVFGLAVGSGSAQYNPATVYRDLVLKSVQKADPKVANSLCAKYEAGWLVVHPEVKTRGMLIANPRMVRFVTAERGPEADGEWKKRKGKYRIKWQVNMGYTPLDDVIIDESAFYPCRVGF